MKVLDIAIRQEKRIKSIQIRRKEVKLSLFADDMILYIDDPKVFIKRVLEPASEFSKVSGYMVNIQTPVAFLHTNSELSERENKKAIPFKIATKRIKYLGINLIKEVKDPHSKNHKTLIKETKNDTNI